jgi:hypothetical protein
VIIIAVCFRHVSRLRMMKYPDNLEYCIEETRALCWEPDVLRIVKSRWSGWTGHVAKLGDT